jgi:cytochrome P450
MGSIHGPLAGLLRKMQENAAANSALLLWILGATCVAFLSKIVYNIFFHPLAHIPGPKLAAITNLWAIYYELQGTLPWTVEELSKKNGWKGAIRVGPNRIAVHDPKQYDIIYRVGSKFMKDPWLYRNFPSASTGSLTTTSAMDKTYHSGRRKATMGKLSRQKVGELHFLVKEKLELLMSRFQDNIISGKPVDVFSGWRSMTMDIISTFTFGTGLNSLSDPNLDHHMLHILDQALTGFYMFARIPAILKLVNNPLFNWMIPGMQQMSMYKKWARECILSYTPDPKQYYLFDTLMSKETVPRLSIDEIQNEAEDILIAGSDTTATTLTYACVNMAAKPDLWEKLYEELKPIYGDRKAIPQMQVLEKLPFLNACLKESLRLASPVPSYLWRLVPADSYTIDARGRQYSLPPGTSVGMSQALVHFDEDTFPDPSSFDPYRWLKADGTLHNDLDSFLVPFSKGTRQCGGINLAWMELWIALATTVVRFKIEGNVGDNVIIQKDCFVGVPTKSNYNIHFSLRE